MNIHLSKKAVWPVIINCLLIAVVFIIDNLERNLWIKVSLCIYLMALIINSTSIYRLKGKIISFPFIIYGLYFLFHLSQIYFGFINLDDFYCIFTRMDFVSIKKSFNYAYYCIHIMIIVYYLMVKKNGEKSPNIDLQVPSMDKELIRILFYISYLMKLVIQSTWLYIGVKYGYLQLLNSMSSITSLIIMIADIFAIMFLLYCCSEKNRQVFLIAILILEIIFMASGSRILGITFILLILLLVPYRVNALKKKIFICLFLLVIIIILPTISANRLSTSATNIFSLDFLENSNIIVSIIKEFGMTILNTTVAIANEDKINFLHGLSYTGAISGVLINLGGIFDELLDKMLYTNQLKEYFNYAYGGSSIAEAFINFKYWGIIIFVPVGILISKIDIAIESLGKLQVTKKIFFIALIFETILWTRSYFFQMIRLPIWLFIFYFVIRNLLYSKKAV